MLSMGGYTPQPKGPGGPGGAGSVGSRWDQLSADCQSALTTAMAGPNSASANALRLAALDRATAAASTLQTAAQGTVVPWQLLAAIGIRETNFQNISQANGNGRGIFQIDIGVNPSVTAAQAFDPAWAAAWAANRLDSNYFELASDHPNFTQAQLWQATAASYNFGTGNISGNPNTIDVGTTGNNYGSNIMNLMKCFQ
jgi:hypothetical protein